MASATRKRPAQTPRDNVQLEPGSADQGRPRPVQPWPPALIFHCPDGDGWTWHANDARGYKAKLERAWRQHLAQHGQGQLLTPEQLATLEHR